MKIGIIGLGLIGGSIFKSLLGKYDLVGVSTSVKGENITDDYDSLKECDLIFVCTPMNVTLEILDKLETVLPSSAIVADVCSLKEFLTKKSYKFKFIPSHPMAGTENSGWESSQKGLFKNAKWVITPINGEISKEQEILESVIEDLGANVVITTPQEHDKAVALISHMPLVLAQALCENIKENKLAQILASTGFKDTTRLALSNTIMANDMVTLNKANIEDSIKLLKKSIESVLAEDYLTKANRIKEFRKNLYN